MALSMFFMSAILAGCTMIATAIYESTFEEDRLPRYIFGTLAATCALASIFCLAVSLWRAVQ